MRSFRKKLSKHDKAQLSDWLITVLTDGIFTLSNQEGFRHLKYRL